MRRRSALHQAVGRRTRGRPAPYGAADKPVAGRVGNLIGMVLEDHSCERAFASCARLVQRTPVVCGDAWVALLEGAVAQGVLSEEGAEEGARAGGVVRG